MTVTTHRTRSNVTTLKELRDNLGTKEIGRAHV